MAGTAVLERELKTQEEKVTYEEQAKETKTPSAYDFLRAQTMGAWTSPATKEKRAENPFNATAARVRSYYEAPAAPARKKVLFDDYAYVNGELMQKNPETEEMTPVFNAAAAAPAPAYKEVYAPVYEEPVDSATVAEPETEEDEDALPTRRTMESVIRSATVQEVKITSKTQSGFKAALSALSTKMKVVLISVVTAILLAIVLICVNTGIIRSLDSDLTDLKGRATQEQTTYENLQRESDLYTDPDSEIVTDWAMNNGMTK